ncbi:hypothetical protein [Streptomyces sp. A5-4]|uniref:hypothetical protein n=1 Tax=Streptomyces sp. A5-4 TaxID=3384771 RepID=UPI003DA959D8
MEKCSPRCLAATARRDERFVGARISARVRARTVRIGFGPVVADAMKAALPLP